MSDQSVLTSFVGRLNTLVTDLPIVWPGLEYDGLPEGPLWLEARLFPSERDDLHWEGGRQLAGFFQVSVGYRPHSTINRLVAATGEAEKVAAHFPKGLNVGPVYVRKTPHVAPEVIDSDKSFVPVTISYHGT